MSVAERESQAATERANKAALVAQAEADDLRWLMSAKQGRRFVWRQLAEAGVYQVTFTGDALTSAFNEGRRSRGLALLASVTQHCPERLFEMQKEARKSP